MRGAGKASHKTPHRLSFCTHNSQETLLQVRVWEKTNEIPEALAVLPCLPRHPRVYTADARPTHAASMEVAHAHCRASLLTVKGNQPTLCVDLATSFADPETIIAHYEQEVTVDRHRGRTETRPIEVSCGMNDYLAPTWPLVLKARSVDPHRHRRQDRQDDEAGWSPSPPT